MTTKTITKSGAKITLRNIKDTTIRLIHSTHFYQSATGSDGKRYERSMDAAGIWSKWRVFTLTNPPLDSMSADAIDNL